MAGLVEPEHQGLVLSELVVHLDGPFILVVLAGSVVDVVLARHSRRLGSRKELLGVCHHARIETALWNGVVRILVAEELFGVVGILSRRKRIEDVCPEVTQVAAQIGICWHAQ